VVSFDKTYRVVDGQRIEGVMRPAFINNGGRYFLTNLKIYADGVVDCWGNCTLEQFADKVRRGWVATALPDGAQASAHHVGAWTMAEPRAWVDADALIGEVADEIDTLAGRPDSTRRCRAAVDTYLAEPTEANRQRITETYQAIPKHLRVYALGDMDFKDRPLQWLAFDHGEDARQRAVAFFAERRQAREAFEQQIPADGPETSARSTITIPCGVYPSGWPADPGFEVLQNSFPAQITVGDADYPTVTHAYWALSTSDDEQRTLIAEAETPHKAKELAESAPRRDTWSDARLPVMTGLLRAKFHQHPQLAEVLLSTGDAILVSNEVTYGAFWSPMGRHWMGRLLEIVRAELAAERSGIMLTPPTPR
jgi:predicted NAD-dependent protein-ADP-ribosyltransferase YbiA (DUF1768 family)